MEEQAKLAEPANNPKAAEKRNRAWFKPGDTRINRTGRPRKARVPTPEEASGSKRPCPFCGRSPLPHTGRHRTLLVDEEQIRGCLTGECQDRGRVNLPKDARIVAMEPDPAGKGFLITFCSEKFSPVQAEESIPQLVWSQFGQRAAESADT